MKAVVYDQYGPPEVLHLADLKMPTPSDDEVLVRVRATTVSVADVRARSFTVPLSFWIPARLHLGLFKPRRRVLGAELAGDVVAAGTHVTAFAPGDRIFASAGHRGGGYAEYACVLASGAVATIPPNMSYEEAASIPIGARTALHYLQRAKVGPGQRVLIYGASGSVGTYAVQLARVAGAHVTAVTSGANVSLVTSLGADAVIDYTKEDFAAGRERYDVVFVAVDKASFARCMRVLKPGGTYANVTAPLRTLRMWWAALTTHTTVIVGEMAPDDAESMSAITRLIEQRRLRAVVDRRYPLAQIVDAHRYVDQGHKRGNVVIGVT